MSELNYKPEVVDEDVYTSSLYNISSLYDDPKIKDDFIDFRAHMVDLNTALITKCITGTEQDFFMLMRKAEDFLKNSKKGLNETTYAILMDMFKECVFGYYVITPLINAKEVSDIKIYSYNHITCKVNGVRKVTNLSFFSQEDYNKWFDRITRIHHLYRSQETALQYATDRKGVAHFLLRIDVELSSITSSDCNQLHIRKLPKEKYSWEYLIENNMVTDEMVDYIKNRIIAGYGFIISGRGGSGKSTLLNNMIDMIPFNESGLVAQESDELYSNIHPQLQFEHVMEVKKSGEEITYNLEDLLRLGLLQDIDNFIIGEVKGGEALYVFTTGMSTGARFFLTIHANNAAGSVRRLAHCARYISDYPVETLEEMLTATPVVLIHMSSFSVDEILEVNGWDAENACLRFNEIYRKHKKIKKIVKINAS